MKRVVLMVISLLLVVGSATAAMRYEAVTRTLNEKGKTDQEMVVESWVDGERARIQFREVKKAPVPDDAYLITTDGGQTMILVNPKEKTYMEWDLDLLFQSLGSISGATGGMVDLSFAGTSAEYLGAEAGGQVLGHDTTKHRMKSAFTMQVKVFGMKQQTTVRSETESWATSELADAGFGAWLRKTPPATGDDDLDALIRTHAQKIEGVVLKSVTKSVTVDDKGRERPSTTVMEVTSIEPVEVTDEMFAVPTGYERTEMPTLAGHQGGEQGQPPGLGGLLQGLGG